MGGVKWRIMVQVGPGKNVTLLEKYLEQKGLGA
jgi:hypothetical protein